MPSSIWRANGADGAGRRNHKERLCQSRWAITQKLVDLIHASATPPSVLIGSATRLLRRDHGRRCRREDEPPHNEFTHKLCARWEQIACRAPERPDPSACCVPALSGARRKADFEGMVSPPFRLGLSGPVGNGRQYLALDSHRRYGQRHPVAAG